MRPCLKTNKHINNINPKNYHYLYFTKAHGKVISEIFLGLGIMWGYVQSTFVYWNESGLCKSVTKIKRLKNTDKGKWTDISRYWISIFNFFLKAVKYRVEKLPYFILLNKNHVDNFQANIKLTWDQRKV